MNSITKGADGWYVNFGDPNSSNEDDYSTYGPFRWYWQAKYFIWKHL